MYRQKILGGGCVVGGGYLLGDAKVTQPNGVPVANFIVRVKARTRFEETVDYYCSIWGDKAIPLSRALVKGRSIAFLGIGVDAVHPTKGEIITISDPHIWILSMSAKSQLNSQVETLEFNMEELVNG